MNLVISVYNLLPCKQTKGKLNSQPVSNKISQTCSALLIRPW